MDSSIKRALFFDSGVGGLSIYKNVIEQNTDLKSFYLFDHEFFPYGSKDEEFLKQRVLALIQKSIENFGIDLVVIACNTASTTVLPTLRANINIPVVGVVPAIKPAASASKKKIIGLLATPGTISRPYTKELILKFAHDCEVRLLGTTELVYLAESKMHGMQVEVSDVKKVIQGFFDRGEAPDVIVMGCTHFPFLKKEIELAIGTEPEVKLIDSGEAIGKRVKTLLDDEQLYLINETKATDGMMNIYKEDNLKSYAFYTGVLQDYQRELATFKSFGFESLEKFVM